MNRKGIPCFIFEPGKHSLQEQIWAFQHCRGIIAIRGAELTNCIWMSNNSQVIVINVLNTKRPKTPIISLAPQIGFIYKEVPELQEKFSELTGELLESIMKII